jgi:hypothetical protein
MSVRCNDCGAVASYGHEVGHKSGCPSLKGERIRRIHSALLSKGGDDGTCTTGLPVPYPFCRTPEKCAGKGYCPNEYACND